MSAGATPRVSFALAASVLAAAATLAQQPDDPFAAPKRGGLEVEALIRHERNRKIFVSADETRSEDRWRFRLLPRITTGGESFKLVVGGDFNYDPDPRNTEVKDADGNIVKPALLRDNYDSRSARLDLAYAELQPIKWLQVQGGRFPMPHGLTEMLWDKDLRPQGGLVRLSTSAIGDIEGLSGTFLISQGGHVFEDGKSRLMMGSLSAKLQGGNQTRMEVTASYLDFSRLEDLEPMIRRQNRRAADGTLASRFRVADIVGRMVISSGMPMQFVADYAWNTAADDQNRGVWFAAVLGSLSQSRARLEYVYSRVDRDATPAAFATDDFFWGTGWEGHRLELATRSGGRFSGHLIGQIQRFKDSARPEEQEHWMQRLRAELRLTP